MVLRPDFAAERSTSLTGAQYRMSCALGFGRTYLKSCTTWTYSPNGSISRGRERVVKKEAV